MWLVSSLTGLDSATSVHTNNNIFSCLGKSDPLYIVILLPKGNVDWLTDSDKTFAEQKLVVNVPKQRSYLCALHSKLLGTFRQVKIFITY